MTDREQPRASAMVANFFMVGGCASFPRSATVSTVGGQFRQNGSYRMPQKGRPGGRPTRDTLGFHVRGHRPAATRFPVRAGRFHVLAWWLVATVGGAGLGRWFSRSGVAARCHGRGWRRSITAGQHPPATVDHRRPASSCDERSPQASILLRRSITCLLYTSPSPRD